MMHLLWLLPMSGLLCRLKHKRTLHLMQHPLYFLETSFHRYVLSNVIDFFFLFYATYAHMGFLCCQKQMLRIITFSDIGFLITISLVVFYIQGIFHYNIFFPLLGYIYPVLGMIRIQNNHSTQKTLVTALPVPALYSV